MGFAITTSISLQLLLFITFVSSQQYLGCFKDSSNRMLIHLNEVPNTLTTKICTAYCQQLGYAYAGLQYSFQCFCGDSINTALKTVENECNLKCPGNQNEACGGTWRSSVYKIDNPRKGYEYVGCYTDQANPRALSGSFTSSSNLTPFQCIDYCLSRGYLYAGLQYSSQCFCGNNLAYNRVEDKECDYKCSGDPNKICGGSYRNSIYYIGYEYKGCYTDQANPRALSGSLTTLSNLTPYRCMELCSKNGYKYAGLQYGSQCFCGNNLAYILVDEKLCDYKCSGDSNRICGGFYKNSIFYIGYEYKGCYTDQANPRALSGSVTTLFNLTNYRCMELCSKNGYQYAGLQYGLQCFCGNNLAYSLVDDKQCDYKCSGDSNKICGGFYRNSIFYIGYSYVGCYLDHVNFRLLQGYSTIISNQTPFLCIDLCRKKGFKYAGLQNGNRCFCGTTTLPSSRKVNDDQCDTKCEGNVNKFCGAYWKLSIYATGV